MISYKAVLRYAHIIYLYVYASVLARVCITVTSWWPRKRLKSPASRLFTQPFIRAQIKVNIKAPRHWPLCGEFTGDRWIPRINGQQRGKCFHFMTSSWCERENMHGCVTWIQFTQSFHFRWNISYWKHFLNFIKYEYCHSPKSLTKRTRFTYIDEAETKWPLPCRRHFQIHFLTWRWLYIDSNLLKFVRKAAINNTQLFR